MSDGLDVGSFEGVWFHWGCPFCDEINEAEEDPRLDGVLVQCEGCGWLGPVVESQ